MTKLKTRPVLLAAIAAVTLTIFLAILLAIPPRKKTLPLPFDTNNYVASSIYDPFALPANPSLRQRVTVAIYKWANRRQLEHPDPDLTTFGALTAPGTPVEIGCNSCSQASGIRYFMPIGVAVAMVPFTVSTPMKGGAYIAGFEKAMTNAPIDCLNTATGKHEPQQLVLIRFPAQRAVLVLPQGEAAEFQRTNAAGR